MMLSSQQYANLADHGYGRDQQGNTVELGGLVDKLIKIEGIEYKILAHTDQTSGYQGTIYQRADTDKIVVAHRGTEFDREPLRAGVLADGGMGFGQVTSQAADASKCPSEDMQEAEHVYNA